MMKKFGKILLVMAVCTITLIAMMTVSSAATIESVSASVDAGEGRTITVTVEYGSVEAAQQSTILVVKEGTALATLSDTGIKYIDQEAVSETAVQYTFKLLEADRVGTYDVYVGGTNVDAPEKTAFSFDTRKITGKISVLGDATKATAIAGENVGVVKADGTYSIEVGQGTYDVVLGKANYLYKTYTGVVVGTEDVPLGEITLLAGDVTGDKIIDLSDLQKVLDNYGQVQPTLDIDDDASGGIVDLTELQKILDNYQQTYPAE